MSKQSNSISKHERRENVKNECSKFVPNVTHRTLDTMKLRECLNEWVSDTAAVHHLLRSSWPLSISKRVSSRATHCIVIWTFEQIVQCTEKGDWAAAHPRLKAQICIIFIRGESKRAPTKHMRFNDLCFCFVLPWSAQNVDAMVFFLISNEEKVKIGPD